MKTTKRSVLSAIVIVGLMALLTVSLASADSATFSASQDSYIRDTSYLQGNNYGTATKLAVESYKPASQVYNKRTLVQFDVSSIPSGVVIDSATLHLYMYEAPGAGPHEPPHYNRTHEVHRLTDSWVETGVTWIDRSTGVAWTTIGGGGDYDPIVTDSTKTGTTDDVWLTWDVSNDVQQFAGTVPNYGWLIRDEDASTSYQYKAEFRSREYTTDTTKRPRLEVTWHEAPSVNLTVERIDPKYVIENMTNVMMVYVKNTGTLSSYTGNVSLEIRNSSNVVVYEAKNTTNLSAPAAAPVEVRFAWKPTTLENFTLIATVDCDNDIAEANEADNGLTDNRNTTGDCTTDTLVAEACYGYQGQHPMDTVLEYKDKLGVIYTTGNYQYSLNSVEFRIGGQYPNTNLITGDPAVIPTGAEVVTARLYVYYTWRDFDSYGYPNLGMQFWDQSHIVHYPVNEDVNYTDWKGFTDSRTHYMYGTVAYDVTNYVPGNSGALPYQADITQFNWGFGTYGKTSGMALLIMYKDNSLPYVECYVDEGCDRLATRYLNMTEGRWEYYVTPDDATTEAEFPDINNPQVGIMNASLFTITIDALSNTGYSTEETLGFNGNYWQGVWSNGGYSGSDYPIGHDTTDVKSELQDNPAGSPELAEFQERYTPANGFSAANAILMVETKPCLGICYSGTVCNGSVVAINLTCGECINAGLGDSWENYEFESPCNPGYMVPRLCYDYCPECCDGINNFDGDSFTDWPNDPECACCLDETEDLDEGCPPPCVPELATFALVGAGLMMVVGLVRFGRRER